MDEYQDFAGWENYTPKLTEKKPEPKKEQPKPKPKDDHWDSFHDISNPIWLAATCG